MVKNNTNNVLEKPALQKQVFRRIFLTIFGSSESEVISRSYARVKTLDAGANSRSPLPKFVIRSNKLHRNLKRP